MIYDYTIIGGGIAGLYATQELHKKNKDLRLLLCDERNYFGGRLITHQKPHYEIGGARFHDGHPLLLQLLKTYHCHKIPLPKSSLFLEQTPEENIIPYHHVEDTLKSIMNHIFADSKKYSKEYLQKFSLSEYITHEYKDPLFAKKIKDIFGYHSEINVMNASDALLSFEKDFISNQFYIVKEGFSHLCNKMYEYLRSKQNISCFKNTRVNDVRKNAKGEFMVYMTKAKKDKIYQTKNVIFAIKAPQLRVFSLLKPIHSCLSCVYGAPLLRIYAKYPLRSGKCWFDGLPKTITNNILRQIIPIDPSTGLIMISYTDGVDIYPFLKDKRQIILKSDKELQQMIAKELKILFPSFSIPKPSYFKAHLWTLGCHHWKPKCDSEKIIRQVRHPMEHVHVIGEAFSHKQAWTEGALESVLDII